MGNTSAAGNRTYDAAIAPCPDYLPEHVRAALEGALAPIGGLDWVLPGMRVVIKANLVSAMKPAAAATTHPALLCELVKRLTERGASVTIGDSPGGLYSAAFVNRIYNVTGMREAERAGAALNQNFGKSIADFPEAKVLHTFTYTSYLDDCDAIIDFCKLKSHGMMGMSAAAKNMFGTVPGTIKPEYHYKFPNYTDFADMLIDLNEFFKPRLSICDAVEGMEGNGPTAGTPRHIGAVAASLSPHKLDLLCAYLLGLTKDNIPTLGAAYRRGLIPAAAGELTVCGEPERFVVPDFKLNAGRTNMIFGAKGRCPATRVVGAVVKKLLRSTPRLNSGECVGCGVCAGICPAKTIEIRAGKAAIDRSKCICCFCCQEFCPKGAMKVHRPIVARIAGKI